MQVKTRDRCKLINSAVEASTKTFTPFNIKLAFSSTGIHPFNSQALHEIGLIFPSEPQVQNPNKKLKINQLFQKNIINTDENISYIRSSQNEYNQDIKTLVESQDGQNTIQIEDDSQVSNQSNQYES